MFGLFVGANLVFALFARNCADEGEHKVRPYTETGKFWGSTVSFSLGFPLSFASTISYT